MLAGWVRHDISRHTQPLFLLAAAVRVQLEHPRHEPSVQLTHLVGDVDEVALAIILHVTPAFRATKVAVHHAEGPPGFEDLPDLVKRGQREIIGIACEVHRPGDIHPLDLPLLVRIDEDLVAVAPHLVAVFCVTAPEHPTEEGPGVVVRKWRAVLAEIRPTPDVQLDGLVPRRTILDDELRLVPAQAVELHVWDQHPAFATDEPFPGEVRHLFRRFLGECSTSQFVHLVVQFEAKLVIDGDVSHELPFVRESCRSVLYNITFHCRVNLAIALAPPAS